MVRLFMRLALALVILIAPLAARADDQPARAALWRISTRGGTIWLFGTVHLLPRGTRWLSGAVERALDSADEVATEINDPDGKATRALLAARIALPDGGHVSALLDPARRDALGAILKRYGLPAERFDTQKPWFVAAAIATLPLIAKGFDPQSGVEAGIDAHLAGKAVHRIGIETPESQIALLDTLPQPVQLHYLTSVIDEFDTIDTRVGAIFAAWRDGDAARLAQLIREDDGKDDPLITRRLIDDRNRMFARWIAERARHRGTVFVAIGAGHLAGPGSVQARLAALHIRAVRVQ